MWSLTVVLSPDGTMSVLSEWVDGGKIWLNDVNGTKRSLGSGFRLEHSVLASTIRGVPLMWLDNDRILTQRSNGEIVVVKTDGTVEPIVRIDFNHAEGSDLETSSLLDGALYASFSRDCDVNIIYKINLTSNPDSCFLIDVENKSYSLYNLERTALGYGFEYDNESEKDSTVIRYEGE